MKSHTFKKILSLVLAVLMMVSLLPTSAFALVTEEAEDAEDENGKVSTLTNAAANVENQEAPLGDPAPAPVGTKFDNVADLTDALATAIEGTELTLTESATLDEGEEMTVPAGVTLTVAEGKVLSVYGTLINNGIIVGAVEILTEVYNTEDVRTYDDGTTWTVRATRNGEYVADESAQAEGVKWYITIPDVNNGNRMEDPNNGATVAYWSHGGKFCTDLSDLNNIGRSSGNDNTKFYLLKDVDIFANADSYKGAINTYSAYTFHLYGNSHTIKVVGNNGSYASFDACKIGGGYSRTNFYDLTIDNNGVGTNVVERVTSSTFSSIENFINVRMINPRLGYVDFLLTHSSGTVSSPLSINFYDCEIGSFKGQGNKGTFTLSFYGEKNKIGSFITGWGAPTNVVYGGTYTSNPTKYVADGKNILVNFNGTKVASYTVVPNENLTAGSYTKEPGSVAEGYRSADKVGGYYVVEKIPPVIDVNGTEYINVEAALAAIEAGSVVKLLADSDVSFVLPVGAKLNTNGYAYTGEVTPADAAVSKIVEAEGVYTSQELCAATVGTDIYHSLAEAMAAVKDSEAAVVVKLGEDHNNISVELGVNVSLNTNGFAYTGKVSAPAGYHVEYAEGVYSVASNTTIVVPETVDIRTGSEENIQTEEQKKEAKEVVKETAKQIEALAGAVTATKIEESTTRLGDGAGQTQTPEQKALAEESLSIILDAVKEKAETEGKGNTVNAIKSTGTDKVTDQDVDKYLTIKLEGAKVESVTKQIDQTTEEVTTVRKMAFEIKPIAVLTVTTTEEDGTVKIETTEAVIPNNAIKAPISFDLPVADDAPFKQVSVTRDGEYMGIFNVIGEIGTPGRKVTISSDHFSTFTYEGVSYKVNDDKPEEAELDVTDFEAIVLSGDTATPYATLGDALANTSGGERVVLLKSIENSDPDQNVIQTDITLDLNGKSISGSNANGVLRVVSDATLKHGKIINNASTWSTKAVVLNGTAIARFVDVDFEVTTNKMTMSAIKDEDGSATVYIDNGTFNGAIDVCEAYITGGIFNGSVSVKYALEISGGTFNDQVKYTGANAATISGGTFEKSVTTIDRSVSGGNFKTKLTQIKLVDTKCWSALGAVVDGYYTVVDAVAEFNGTRYASVAEAVKAAGTSTTPIKLLANDAPYTLVLNKPVYIDVNGKEFEPDAPTGYSVKTEDTEYSLKMLPVSITVETDREEHTYDGKTTKLTASFADGTPENVAYKWYKGDTDTGIVVGTTADNYAVGKNVSDSGTYKVVAYVGNYSSEDEATVTITKANYDMSGVTFEAASMPYTGVVQNLEVSGTLPTGLDDVQVTVSYSDGLKDVGEKEITATFATTSGNYNTPEAKTAKLTVTTVNATITPNVNSKIAGNKDPELTATVTGTVNDETLAYTLSRVKGEEVGTYTISVTVDETADVNKNYVIDASATAKFTITGAAAKVKHGDVWTYYDTIQKAYNAAEDGDTITLLTDTNSFPKIEKGITVDFGDKVVNGKVTVAAAGKTVTFKGTTGGIQPASGSAISVKNGDLVIESGVYTSTNESLIVDDYGTKSLTVNGGTLQSTWNKNYASLVGDFAGNVTVNGGTMELIQNYNGYAYLIDLDNNAPNSFKPTLTVNDGATLKISGIGSYAFVVEAGSTGATVNVSGGNVSVNAKGYTNLVSGSTYEEEAKKPVVTISDVNYSAMGEYSNKIVDGASSTTVSGGTYNIKPTYTSGKPIEIFGSTTTAVSGGTYTVPVSPEKCAEGFAPETHVDPQTGEVTYGVIESDDPVVAQIIDSNKVVHYYFSLKAAVEEAVEGQTVMVMVPVEVPETIVVNKSITVEPRNNTITSTAEKQKLFQIVNNAKLTVNCNSNNGTSVVITGRFDVGAAPNNNGNLVLNYGNYTVTDNTVIHVNGTCTNSNVTLSSAKVTSNGDNAIQMNGGGVLTLKSATVTGATGIYMKAGTLNFESGKINVNGNGEYKATVVNHNGSDATGDAIVLDAQDGYNGQISVNILKPETGSAPTVNITSTNGSAIREAVTEGDNSATVSLVISNANAKLTGADGKDAISVTDKFLAAVKAGDAVSDISAGTYSSEVPAVLCRECFRAVKQADGTYKVHEQAPVAEVAGVKYTTFTEALYAANEQTGNVVIKILVPEVTETADKVINLKNNTTITTDLEGGAVINLPSSLEYCIEAYSPAVNLVIAENITLNNLGQTIAGKTLDIFGNVNGDQIWAYYGGKVTINSTATVMLSDMFNMRSNGTVTVNGNFTEGEAATADYKSITPQFKSEYFKADKAGTKNLNLNNTYVQSAWYTNDQGTFNITLDNSILRSTHEGGEKLNMLKGTLTLKNGSRVIIDSLNNGKASGIITLNANDVANVEAGSTITVGTVTSSGTINIGADAATPAITANAFNGSNGTINVNMTGAEIPDGGLTVISCSGTANYGTYTLTGNTGENADYVLAVIDGDLKIVKGNVAVTSGAKTEYFYTMDDALVAAMGKTGNVTLTLLKDFTDNSLVNGRSGAGQDGYAFANNLTITADEAVTVDLGCATTAGRAKGALVAAPGGSITIDENVTLNGLGAIGNYHYHEKNLATFAPETDPRGSFTINGKVTAYAVYADNIDFVLGENGSIIDLTQGDKLFRADDVTNYTVNGNLSEVTENITDFDAHHACITIGDNDPEHMYDGTLNLTLNKAAVTITQANRSAGVTTSINVNLNGSFLKTGNPSAGAPLVVDTLSMTGNSIYKAAGLSLPNGATLTAGSKIFAEGITLDEGKTINVNMSAATADSYLIVDNTKTDLTDADLAMVKLTNVSDTHPYVLKLDGGNIYAVKAVAKIGSTYYETLAEAIEKAAVGAEIILVADIAATLDNPTGANVTVWNIHKSITLNGNGHKITVDPSNWDMIKNANGEDAATGNVFGIMNPNPNDVHVTIKNLELIGNACMKHGFSVVSEDKAAGAKKAYATFDNVKVSGCGAYSINCVNSDITIDGENTDINKGGWGAAVAVDHNKNYANSSDVKIMNGDIETVYVLADEAAISGGTVGTLAITGGDAAISGGKVENLAIYGGTATITGGTVTNNSAAAKIGNVYYATLADAVKAATAGQTVELLADASGDGIQIDKNIEINLGGHTYTVNGNLVGSSGTKNQAFQLLKDNNITIKNGTLTTTKEVNAKFIIQNYADLTLEDVTVDGANLRNDEAYALSVNNGDVELKGTTELKVDTSNEKAVALDLYDYAKGGYDGVDITIGDNATITGPCEVGGDRNTLDIKVTAPETKLPAAPANYDWVKNEQDEYVLTPAVAKIGEGENAKYYATLAKAITAVGEGQTITMIADVANANGISVPGTKKFTVDFGGHTYTINHPGAGSKGTSTQGFQLLKGSEVTFKNGTINVAVENKSYTWTGDPRGIAWVINNYGALTLDNMTVDGTNVAKNLKSAGGLSDPGIIRYVINNYYGSLTTKNNTVITAASGDVAVSANWYNSMETASGTYADAKPTVSLTGTTVNGKVEAISGTVNLETGTTVNGQVRVGENGLHSDRKTAGASGAIVNIKAGATVQNAEYPVVVFGVNTLNVNGTVKSTSTTSNDTAAISTNGNAYNAGSVINIGTGANVTSETCSAIYMPNGTLNITDGAIEGPTAVYFKSTDLSITGGTLTGNGEEKEYKFNGNGCNPTGEALVIDNCNYPSGINAPVITGGTFISEKANAVGSYAGNGQTEALKNFVAGGSFSSKVPLEYCAEDYMPGEYDPATEMYTVIHSKAVATITTDDNTVYYASLADAIAAAPNGTQTTVTLLANCESEGITVPENKNIILDFDGKTVTFNKPGAGSTGTTTQAFQLLKNSTIVFKDGTINVAEDNLTAATAPAKNIKRIIQNYANLTLEDMTIDGTNLYVNDSNTNRAVIETANGAVALTGSTSVTGKTEGNVAALNVDTWKNAYPAGTQVTVNTTGIIDGIYCYSEGTAATYEKSTLNLTAGTVNKLMADGSEEFVVTKTGVNVAAPAGYDWDANNKLVPAVAQIGDKYYDTLAEAVADAAPGAKVKMIANDTGDGIKINKNIEIDLGGFTYTVNGNLVGSRGTENQAFQVLQEAGSVTFKNGTLTTTAEAGARFIIQNYADLTLDNVTLDGSKLNHTKTEYTLSNNSGHVTVKDSTIIAKDGGIAMDTCKYGSYNAPAVKVEGKSKINGNVELAGGDLALNSGKLTGELVAPADTAKFSGTVTKVNGFNAEAPKGYKWTDNGKLVPVNAAVAQNQNTEKKYATLEEALDEAKSGETVVLLADIDGEKYVIIESGVTLDLAGHSITGAKLIYANGVLTDSNTAARGYIKATAYMFNDDETIGDKYMPIYDTSVGGYRLVQVHMLSAKRTNAAGNPEVDFNFGKLNRDYYFGLFTSDKENYNKQFKAFITVTWTDVQEDGKAIKVTQEYLYNDIFMNDVVESNAADMFMATITGFTGAAVAQAKFVTYDVSGNKLLTVYGDKLELTA